MRVLVLSLLLCLWGYTSAQNDVELSFIPAGGEGNTYKKGGYVKVICTAKRQILDLLEVKKDLGGTKYDVSTNNLLVETFKNTGRYALLATTVDDYQETQISIQDLRGQDSGTIECTHTLLDGTKTTATESFKVMVPPESVEIFQYNDGDVSSVAPGAKLIMVEGEDHGIICKVNVAGSDDAPQVDIAIDGKSVMDIFTKEEEKKQGGVGGLQQKNLTVMYEYLTQEPTLEYNGKTLSCSASTQGYEAISQSVTLEVHYKPRLDCEMAQSLVGQSAKIVCRGDMFPEVELLSVSWTRVPDRFELSLDEPVSGRHSLSMKQGDNGKYEFIVDINSVEENDFGNYRFEVQNSHSSGEAQVELGKGAETPAPPTPPTDPPYKVTDTPGEVNPPKPTPGSANGLFANALGALVALLMSLFVL